MSVTGDLYEVFSKIKIEVEYENRDRDDMMECTFEFPMSDKTIVKSLVCEINGERIESFIMEKEESKNYYDDNIAKGNLVFMGTSEKEKKKMTMAIGNLLPGQTCKVQLEVI